jgi:hypothetical protein
MVYCMQHLDMAFRRLNQITFITVKYLKADIINAVNPFSKMALKQH